MQEIKDLLSKAGVNLGDAELETLVAKSGLKVTNENVAAIAEFVIKQTSTLAKGGTAGKATKKTSARNAKPVSFSEAAQVAASNTQLELDAVSQALAQGAEQYSDQASEDLLEIIRGVPNKTLTKFTQKALEDKADVDTFRSWAVNASQQIFGFAGGDESE